MRFLYFLVLTSCHLQSLCISCFWLTVITGYASDCKQEIRVGSIVFRSYARCDDCLLGWVCISLSMLSWSQTVTLVGTKYQRLRFHHQYGFLCWFGGLSSCHSSPEILVAFAWNHQCLHVCLVPIFCRLQSVPFLVKRQCPTWGHTGGVECPTSGTNQWSGKICIVWKDYHQTSQLPWHPAGRVESQTLTESKSLNKSWQWH